MEAISDERRCQMTASNRDESGDCADFREEGDFFLATLPATGFEARELDVAVAARTVTFRGHKVESSFDRKLHLPADADAHHLTASLEDGVLQLRARREPALRRVVPVKKGHVSLYAEAAGN